MRLLSQAAIVAAASAAATWPGTDVTTNTFDVTGLDLAVDVTGNCIDATGGLITAVTDDTNADVTSSVTASKVDTDTCRFDVSGLMDGAYTFGSTAVTLDRAPTGNTAINQAFTVFAGEQSREIVLPQGLLGANPTAPAEWKITGATLTSGTGSGFSLVAGKLGAAKFYADKVTSGQSVWTLTATADNGDTTVSPTVTVNVRGDSNSATPANPTPLLTLQDGRGVSAAQRFSAAGNFYSSTANFEIKVSFSDAQMFDNTKTVTKTGTVAFVAPVSSNGGRTWTIAATGAATGDTFSLPAGFFYKTVNGNNVLSAATGTLTVKLQADSTFAAAAITATDGTSATLTAATDRDYFMYIPAGLFANAQGAVEITAATTPQMGAGLRLLPGKLGRAAIQGKVLAANLPAASAKTGCYGDASINQVVFNVMAKDATGKTANAFLCVAVETIAAANEALSFDGTALAAVEGTPVSIDAAATNTISDATKIIAYVETPDFDSATAGQDEKLNNVDSYTAVAGSTASLYKGVKSGLTNAAGVQAAVRAITYENTIEDAVSTDAVNKRAVRLVLAKASPGYNADATDGVSLAVATRPINYQVENDAPALTGATTAAAFAEGASKTPLYSGFAVADNDDTMFRQATVTISAGCDKNDRLALSTVSTAVGSNWNADKCQLTLTPKPGASTITNADLTAAVKNVVYMTNKPSDPNSGSTAAAVARTVTLAVTDDASNKHKAAPAVSSASLTLTVTSVKSAPQFKPEIAYGAGGIFASADPNANPGTVAGVSVRKPVLVNNADAQANGQSFTFDFNGGSSKYGNGALVFTDSANTYITQASDIKVGTVIPGTGAAGTLTVNGGAGTLLATVTATSPELYRLTVVPSADAAGEFTIPLYYQDPNNANTKTRMDFVFDVRAPACHLAGGYAAATEYPDPTVCTAATSTYTGTAATVSQGTIISQRGAFSLDVAANSIASTSNVALTGQAVSATQKSQLPNFSTPGSVVDFGTAVSFGPAGTKFTEPATVCVNAGVIPTGFKGVLAVSSQIDVNDASKGYTEWELLGGQSSTAVTSSDKLCGELGHFSVVAVVLVPTTATSSAQKTFQMGASCPNSCSGKGFCRESGQCLCFDGFTGYDCSLRTCAADESWDLPADGSVAHKAAECSGRGACDRKTGLCACYPGFEGAACNRVSCPNDCSGHGKCRLLSESPAGNWENHRIQMCDCDAGYTGEDCSQRVCAFGDDPETVCTDNTRQKQRVSIDFGTLPAGIDGSSAAFSDLYNNDELTLAFTTKGGQKFYTPRIAHFWNDNAGSALATALKSLPSFAVSDVSVSSTVSSNYAKVDLDVEFTGSSLQFSYNNANGLANTLYQAAGAVAGNTVSGGQNKLSCDTLSGVPFLGGCNGQGCRPAHKQARLFDAEVKTGASFAALNNKAILLQPEASPITATNNFNSPGVWGVQVVVTVTSDGTANGATYKYDTTVYGEALASSEEMPLPSDDLRMNVPIAYGLHLDFDTGIIPAGINQMQFSWRLPKCTVTEEVAASSEFEVYECSNRGVCDRKSGQCQCFNGYSGYNCGQQTIVV